jgi:hypothetical protein
MVDEVVSWQNDIASNICWKCLTLHKLPEGIEGKIKYDQDWLRLIMPFWVVGNTVDKINYRKTQHSLKAEGIWGRMCDTSKV